MTALTLIRDLRHERHIRHLGKACVSAHAAGDREAASMHWEQLRHAIAARSPRQIQRMEASMGRSMRRRIKVLLVQAFCYGWMPAAFVTTTFRLLNLGGL